MNQLSIFDFETNPVRIVTLDEAPHWVATDLAACLGYRDALNMSRMLDDDQKGTHLVSTLGGEQSLSIVTEGGMWTCVIRSKRPEAKRFVRWLTEIVLPTLRRTGSYTLPGIDADAIEQASDHEPYALAARVAVVREARRLYGMNAARSVWAQLGLPTCTPDHIIGGHADPMAAPLADWLANVAYCTIEDAARGLGLKGMIDKSTRIRIGALLRAFGWADRKVKRAGQAVNCFFPEHSPISGNPYYAANGELVQ